MAVVADVHGCRLRTDAVYHHLIYGASVLFAHKLALSGTHIADEGCDDISVLVGIGTDGGIERDVCRHTALRHEGEDLRILLRSGYRSALAHCGGLLGEEHLLPGGAVIPVCYLLTFLATQDVEPAEHVGLALHVPYAATFVADERLQFIAGRHVERQFLLVHPDPCLCCYGEWTRLFEIGELRSFGSAVDLVHLILQSVCR